MALIKKNWLTTLAGLGCIAVGLFDLYKTGSLNANNIVAFTAGWGFLNSKDADK